MVNVRGGVELTRGAVRELLGVRELRAVCCGNSWTSSGALHALSMKRRARTDPSSHD